MRVVHFTRHPESFKDKFIVHDTDYAFGGLCVYKLKDVQCHDDDEDFPRNGIQEMSEAWGGRTALIIEANDEDITLLQAGITIDGLDEYVINVGSTAEIIEERN